MRENIKRIFAKPDLCTGCRLCGVACSTANKGVANYRKGAILVRQDLFERYEFQSLCRHCDPAPCVDACMTGCLTREPETGNVLHDDERCVGCRMCAMVCPFDAIGRDEERDVAVKCTLCPDREQPACVEVCPTGALVLAGAEGEGAPEM